MLLRAGTVLLCGILVDARGSPWQFDRRGLKVPLTVISDVRCVSGCHSHESRCAIKSEALKEHLLFSHVTR